VGGEAHHEITESDGGAFAAVKAQGRLANTNGVEPPPSDTGAVTGLVDPPSTQTGSSDHRDVLLPLTSGETSVTAGETATNFILKLRPQCKHPEACGGYGDRHCHSCLIESGVAA
jgi:hypothetical protein